MAISNLKDVYIEEMRDLWSANDQMQKFMKNLSAKASDPKLKDMLEESATGIGKHTETLKSLPEEIGGNTGADHCKCPSGNILSL
jgi:ferritin-like metal-binding protein YciE